MALHDRIALQVGSLGIRAELNAAGFYADNAIGHSGVIPSRSSSTPVSEFFSCLTADECADRQA
jgi:hypothetical protein